MASFQLHYVNSGTVPLLREAWVNLYRLDEAEVSQKLDVRSEQLDERAAAFANEVYTAEMCLLMGEHVSETAGAFAGGCTNGSCAALGAGAPPPGN